MHISMRGDYGLRAVIDLASHYGEGPIQSSEIARRQRVPEPYLDQLLTVLRKAGFIKSVRGPQGGHSLLCHPAHLMVGDVLVALEGSLVPIVCVEETASCQLADRCAMREVWRRVKEAADDVLNSITIEELARRQAGFDRRDMYHI